MNELKDKIEIIYRKKISDERGWFLKIINGEEKFLPNHTGEIYVVSALPRETRGGHYHEKALEWFSIVIGQAILKLEDINTKEQYLIEMNASDPVTVFVPVGIAHVFINKGNQPFVVVAYTDELYNPLDTICYKFK